MICDQEARQDVLLLLRSYAGLILSSLTKNDKQLLKIFAWNYHSDLLLSRKLVESGHEGFSPKGSSFVFA